MTEAQEQVLRVLRDQPRRDIYEAGGLDGKHGCGEYWVTYSAGERYSPLSQAEVDDLVKRRIIVARYPDAPNVHCYRLVSPWDKP